MYDLHHRLLARSGNIFPSECHSKKIRWLAVSAAMFKTVSERLHVGGLVIQLALSDDSFVIVTDNDDTGLC